MNILTPKLYSVDRHVLATEVDLPDGRGPFPAAVLLPGFLGTKDEPHMIALAEALTGAGIVSLRFDTAGSGASEGTKEDYLLSNYMNDIDSMINYLGHQKFVNRMSIGLWGYGMGGMAAVCFAGDYPSRIRAVAAVSAPDSMAGEVWKKEVLERWQKDKSFPFETGNGTVSIPYTFLKDASRYNAVDAAGALKCPFLCITGTADATVLPALSKRIFAAAPEPKKLLEVEEMGHAYGDNPEFRQSVTHTVCNFLAEVLC